MPYLLAKRQAIASVAQRSLLPEVVARLLAGLAVGVSVAATCCGAEMETGSRPNIVLILIDDLGYGDLGCYGSTIHRTPHIDRLATEGMRFTDFHTNGPVCSPTRAALLTGQYQQRSGIEYALPFDRSSGMPLAKTTLAELLGGAGYSCSLVGKWHLGYLDRFGPNHQGFDRSWCSSHSPDYHTHVSRVGEIDWFQDHKLNREPGYLTDLVTRHACEFLKSHRDGPMFLFVSHLAMHFPFQGPTDPPHRTVGKIWHDQKYGPLPKSEYPRAYRDMLAAVDESVGEVVGTLDRLDLRRQTLILLLSDNGAYSWVGSNGPLRGQKGDLYEGGHRVPLIANWPGRIEPGSVTDAVAMTMDLMPTVLALAAVEKPAGLKLDGCDLSPLLLHGRRPPDRTLFWRFNNMYTSTHAHAVRRGRWKYLVEDGTEMLFDLDEDLGEQRNLIDRHPAVAKPMAEAYARWNEDVTVQR